MATTVNIPQWGMGISEGKIVKWLKQEGDAIKEGEPLVEIETAKAVQEMEAPESGILLKILLDEGQSAPVRSVIGVIGEAGEDIADLV